MSSAESLVILGNTFNTKESANRQHLDVGNRFGKFWQAAYIVKGANETLKEEGHISTIRNGTEDITTDSADIKSIIREYYEDCWEKYQ